MNTEPDRSVATSRRSRRTVVCVAIAVVATIPIATGASGASDKPTSADPTESTVPTTGTPDETADAVEPNLDTSIVDDVVRLTFILPDGWVNNGWFINKLNSDPTFGAIFDTVGNIFSDPCKWVDMNPVVGPSVDDLATALASVPALNATAASDVTVDGYHGKQVEFTVPDYTDDLCDDGHFALFRDTELLGVYWAQGPFAHHRLWILDVDGIRLVIGGTYFPDTSQQDLDDLDTLLNSIQIDPVDAEQSDDDDPVETSAAPSTSAMVDSPLAEPSRDEVAAASNAGIYVPGSGVTEVTATRSYVSLRTCDPPGFNSDPVGGCDGPEGWAYVTGSVDSPGVHYGLLGVADDLVLSALDDRLFVASAASFSQDQPSAPPAWLIDSVTGHRGLLTWHDEPTTLDSAEQVLALFPAPNPIPWNTDSGERFLPRVVDRRDWTIRPMSVPDDATVALAIHQPGSGRIWIGTAPDDGHVGLAYTDDGGASWMDVELPASLSPTSEELLGVVPGGDQLLVVAASGDHVAVTNAWQRGATDVLVSADAGETWNTVRLDPADGNGRKLYVLSDGRLMVVLSNDFQAIGLQVSSSPSDWAQLEDSDHSGYLAGIHSAIDVYQHGLVVNYDMSGDVEGSVMFSTVGDFTDWWTIPGLEFCVNIEC